MRVKVQVANELYMAHKSEQPSQPLSYALLASSFILFRSRFQKIPPNNQQLKLKFWLKLEAASSSNSALKQLRDNIIQCNVSSS